MTFDRVKLPDGSVIYMMDTGKFRYTVRSGHLNTVQRYPIKYVLEDNRVETLNDLYPELDRIMDTETFRFSCFWCGFRKVMTEELIERVQVLRERNIEMLDNLYSVMEQFRGSIDNEDDFYKEIGSLFRTLRTPSNIGKQFRNNMENMFRIYLEEKKKKDEDKEDTVQSA